MARDAGDQMTIDRLEMQAKNAQEAADRRGERLERADATIDQLEAQKADLLAALKACAEFWRNGTPIHFGSDVVTDALAAIDAAEGR